MIHYPKLIHIILNLTEIEALPKYIQNKSSEIQILFSAEIPALVRTTFILFIRVLLPVFFICGHFNQNGPSNLPAGPEPEINMT